MNLEHAAINVPNPIEFAQWLVDHLGMRIVAASKEAPYMHFVTDDMGSMIELYNNPIAPMPNYEEINPFNLHFAFSSSDIEADSARLQAAGARLHAPISTTAAGDKLVFLRAPNGVTIQFVQRKKPMI